VLTSLLALFSDRAAEARADALEKRFLNFDEAHPDVATHMNAEAELRQQVASLTAEREKYRQIYGDPSTLPPDVQKLEAQLRLKTDEIQKLQAQSAQHLQVCLSHFPLTRER
jgi:E3 ubiquitin-protein ligase BRE1